MKPPQLPRTVVAVLLVSPLLAACGGKSDAQTAQDQVCAARADIAKHVQQLQDTNLATFTADGVRKNVQTIKDDLSTISGATGKLNDQRRADVKAANDAFKATVQDTAAAVGKSVSVQDAKTTLNQAFDELAATYRNTLAKIDCA
jgi:hypothetical protein